MRYVIRPHLHVSVPNHCPLANILFSAAKLSFEFCHEILSTAVRDQQAQHTSCCNLELRRNPGQSYESEQPFSIRVSLVSWMCLALEHSEQLWGGELGQNRDRPSGALQGFRPTVLIVLTHQSRWWELQFKISGDTYLAFSCYKGTAYTRLTQPTLASGQCQGLEINSPGMLWPP